MKKRKLKKFYKIHKKKIIIAAVVLLLAIIGGGVYLVSRSSEVTTREVTETVVEEAEPEIVLVPSPLSGGEVSPDLANLPLISVIVENSPDARPQSGLDRAGAVFESVAEGGITRFVAVYQEQMGDKIGPVRSLRTYHIDIAMGFDSGIAHVGGDPKALVELRSLAGRDLDQYFNAGAYWRSADRFAPHNMYTAGENLRELMRSKGFNSSDFSAWSRKADSPLEVPTASSITINPSSYLYHVDYSYDATTNTYKRSMADQLHRDNETGQILTPNVVVVMKASHSIVDADGHYAIDLTGSGEAWVFQDGGVQKVQWKKSSRTGSIAFVDTESRAVNLNIGQVWATIIPTDKTVEYAP